MFPVLPALMLAAQIGKGIAEGGRARRLENRANAIHGQIPQVDPGVQGQLNDIRLRHAYAENGNSRMLAFKRRMIEDAGAQTGANITRAAGSAPGGVQQGLLRSQKQTQDALMGAGAQSEALAPQYLAMETPLISDIADRTLNLQSYLRDNAAFQGAQARQNSNNAITGAMGMLSMFDVNGLGSGGGATKSATANPGAQIGNPSALSSYVDPSMGPEVTGMPSVGQQPWAQPSTFQMAPRPWWQS